MGGEGVNRFNLACVRRRRFGESTPHCYNKIHGPFCMFSPQMPLRLYCCFIGQLLSIVRTNPMICAQSFLRYHGSFTG